VIAYKFLHAEGIAPFTGWRWEPPSGERPGPWVEGGPQLHGCRSGVHACRGLHLPYWINDELWEVELAGRIVETDLKLTAERGRLLRRLQSWDVGLKGQFAEACAWRVLHHALVDLRSLTLSEWVTRLESCSQLSAASALIQELADVSDVQRRPSIRTLLAYFSDAVEYASSDVAGTAYIAAKAAERTSAVDAADPFRGEREWQARWLAKHLGLDGWD
jgi:hypothetical protein